MNSFFSGGLSAFASLLVTFLVASLVSLLVFWLVSVTTHGGLKAFNVPLAKQSMIKPDVSTLNCRSDLEPIEPSAETNPEGPS